VEISAPENGLVNQGVEDAGLPFQIGGQVGFLEAAEEFNDSGALLLVFPVDLAQLFNVGLDVPQVLLVVSTNVRNFGAIVNLFS
jgi:hypothetical protein